MVSTPRRSRRRAPWRVAVVLGLVGAAQAGCGGSVETADLRRAAATEPGLIVGIGANTLEGGLGREQDVVRRLGVRWIREELSWADVEPHRGRFAWRRFDALVAQAARRRMRVLPTITSTPRWLARDENRLPPPAAWGRFVGRVVARYGPRGRFWRAHPELDAGTAMVWFELWNEPYFEFFSTGGPDPQRFAAMQRAAVRAGRAADPGARFLLAAETGYRAADGTDRDWLEDLYAADPELNDSFDGVVSHPYGTGSPKHSSGSRKTQTLRLDDLLRELDAHGAQRRPVWITEIGWATCRVRPACTTEDEQARDFSELFELVSTRWRERVAAVFVYHLRDFTPGDRDEAGQHFGLLRLDGSRKRSWRVLQAAARAAAAGPR